SIAVGHFNPLAGRLGWGGYSANYPSFNRVTVDLLPYAGLNVQFRFRLGTDHVVGAVGWWVDDVQVSIGYAACPSGTPSPTPFVVGHVRWQGRPATASQLNALPISLTLRMQAGGPRYEYDSLTTDAESYFDVPVGGL